MCGRFTNTMTWAEIYALYNITQRAAPPSNLEPRYNLAPTQRAPIVRLGRDADAGEREATVMRWVLIPSWAHPKHHDS